MLDIKKGAVESKKQKQKLETYGLTLLLVKVTLVMMDHKFF